MIAPSLTAMAQDNPLCQGLSAADCEELLAAQSSVAMMSSFTIPAFEVGLTLNIPSMGEGMDETNIEISASGSGGVSLDMMSDVVVHLVLDEATVSDSMETTTYSDVELIMTPTTGYIKWEGEWYGEELSEGDLPTADDLGMIMQYADLNSLLMMSGVDLTGVVMSTRDGDVFTTDVDVAGLLVAALQSPMVGQLVGGEIGMTEQDMAMFGAFLPPLLGTTSLTATTGISDGYLSMLGMDMVIDLDLALLGMGKITGNLNFMVEMSGINEPVMAEVPADYLPMSELDADLSAIENLGSGLGL
jgi:hypothetical protein